MRTESIPTLLTAGEISRTLGVPLPRVSYILATRPHIKPAARAGTLRLYFRQAVAQVRHELNAIAARRCRDDGPTADGNGGAREMDRRTGHSEGLYDA